MVLLNGVYVDFDVYAEGDANVNWYTYPIDVGEQSHREMFTVEIQDGTPGSLIIIMVESGYYLYRHFH